MSEPLLATHGLVKRYGRREVVSGVSLEVRPGEIVGLLGVNGAGKTTSFRMVVGLIRPEGGRVELLGRDVTRVPMYRRARLGLGYLAQEPSVFVGLTVEENLLAILETTAAPRAERRMRAGELLESFGLTALRRTRAGSLSGGERRRLEIARALVTSPRVMLFDEPFSGIDPIAVLEIRRIIRALKDRGLGVLLTDHNVRETLSTTDRAYMIDAGRVWKEGSSRELAADTEAKRVYLGEDFKLD